MPARRDASVPTEAKRQRPSEHGGDSGCSGSRSSGGSSSSSGSRSSSSGSSGSGGSGGSGCPPASPRGQAPLLALATPGEDATLPFELPLPPPGPFAAMLPVGWRPGDEAPTVRHGSSLDLIAKAHMLINAEFNRTDPEKVKRTQCDPPATRMK